MISHEEVQINLLREKQEKERKELLWSRTSDLADNVCCQQIQGLNIFLYAALIAVN